MKILDLILTIAVIIIAFTGSAITVGLWLNIVIKFSGLH